MSTIFDQKLYEIGEDCYIVCASVEAPYLYSRFKCVVQNRNIQNDNITYFCTIKEVLEDKEHIKQYIHQSTFRMYHVDANRGQLKPVNCFDLLFNMSSFNSRFAQRFGHFTIPVPSVHMADTLEGCNQLLASTITIMNQYLNESIQHLLQRQQLLSLTDQHFKSEA